eukprot:1417384-Pyramimonas_sp.AAC.1
MQHEHNDCPDHAWGSLVKCVQEVAHKYYAQRTRDDVTVQEGRGQQRERLTCRANLREQLGNTGGHDEGGTAELARVCIELNNVTRDLRRHAREARAQRLDSLAQQIKEAWRKRDLALIARLSRRMAMTAVGPGKRFHNVPMTIRPTCE